MERNMVARVLKELRRYGIAEKIHGSMMQTKGLPDVIGCVRREGMIGRNGGIGAVGQFIGVEIKDDESKEPTPIQRYWGEQIEKAGGLFFLVRSERELESLKAALRGMCGGAIYGQ